MKNRNIIVTTILLTLAWFALSPSARAVFPAPDGGYPGDNTAEGTNALFSRTTGVENTALGFSSLLNLTIGNSNTGVGLCTLVHNIAGGQNVATGAFALFNTNGSQNVATGYKALFSNTTANQNVATGYGALYRNTTGTDNASVGYQALLNNVTGSSNTAIGFRAGYSITGSGNVCIGSAVLGVAGEINTTRIRNVYGSVAGARAVYVNSDNKIGTLASSRRYKEDIKPMDKASETIFALRPVTFRYKKEVDPAQAVSFGLIAEEVAEISSDLITRDEEGNPRTVRYEAVNAMLLNEFVKEHRKLREQEATITELKSTAAKQKATITQLKSAMAALTETVKEQGSQIQKVNARLELQKASPQTVVNNQ